MADTGAFSLLPGTANAGNASLGHANNHHKNSNSSGGGAGSGADVALMNFNIQSTRKTVEILQAQVQLLAMRVDTLERQNAFLLTVLQHHHQQQPHPPMGVPGTNGSGTSPFLAAKQPGADGTSKQLDDDLHRLGLTTTSATTLNSPKQHMPLDPFSAGSAFARQQQQQQQLAVAMAQHQREEAIMQMLQGQSSPTTATPTAPFPQGFPIVSPTTPILPPGGPMGADPATVAGMAYLYSPNTNGVPNAQQQQHMMLPQHNGGTGGVAPLFAVGGGGVPPSMNPYFALPGSLPSPNNMVSGAAQLATTVTLDPNKHNNNESLDRACQQPWLKELIMKNCKGISNFAPISRLRNLWKLNLQGCSQYVDDSVVKLIAMHNKRLSRLNLCGCEKIASATALQQLSFLFDLNLSGCNITNESLEAVASGCQQLSRLAINSCPLVSDISPLRKLKELKLLYCRYSGHISPASIVQVLHEIGGGLLTLNVDGVKFPQLPGLADANAVMGTVLPTPLALKNLNMKDNTELISIAWLTSFPNAEKHFASLELLDVEGCANLTDLAGLERLPSVKFLRLSKTGIPQDAVDQIVARCPAVTTIYIDGCPNVKTVAAFAKMPSLTKIIVDPGLNSTPASVNGLTVLYQSGHVEVVFASHHSNNSNNNSQGGSGGHFGGNAISPSGSPTSNFVPTMPTSDKK